MVVDGSAFLVTALLPTANDIPLDNDARHSRHASSLLSVLSVIYGFLDHGIHVVRITLILHACITTDSGVVSDTIPNEIDSLVFLKFMQESEERGQGHL